jgi:type IV pilus assembly protein PilA
MYNMIQKNRENGKKGFTLAELLVVVAIIAVLVAISIPIFTSQLEKSREATDVANMRAAKAAAVVAYLDGNNSAVTAMKYDAASGKLVASTETVTGYGKGTTTDGKTKYSDYDSTKAYTDQVITVSVNESGTVTETWSK